MAMTAAAVVEHGTSAGLYLWMLEQNHAAQAFHEARGGRCSGDETFEPPGVGRFTSCRYVWPDPSALLAD
jgi:hypothetical protein